MKVTVLLENASMYNSYLASEHGFSAWIEDDGVRVLVDCGYSDKFIQNAEALGIDLTSVDYVVLTHGHIDHTGGLKHLIRYFEERGIRRKPLLLYTGDDLFFRRFAFDWAMDVGIDLDKETLAEHFELRVSPGPLALTKRLLFMGRIDPSLPFERETPLTSRQNRGGVWCDDYVAEDSQVCYLHENGEDVSVIAACAHSGICSIMEKARELTGAANIHTFLGGSHLRRGEVSEAQIAATVRYLREHGVERLYLCHCTDLYCRMALYAAAPEAAAEAGTGLQIELH